MDGKQQGSGRGRELQQILLGMVGGSKKKTRIMCLPDRPEKEAMHL